MKKRIRFILNLRSGNGRQKLVPPVLEKEIDKSKFDYDIRETESPKHATELSREAAEQAYDSVIAVGGDGTVNEVGRALIGTETSLGIIPMGSGNGIARSLRIPTSPVIAIRGLNRTYTRKIDTGKLNNEVFIGVAGIGFDAHIATLFSSLKSRGLKSYIRLIAREYTRYKAQEYELNVHGEKSRKIALMMTFANTTQFGNEARIAPKAAMDDGLLEVCMLKKFPLYVLPSLSLRLFSGKIHTSVFYESLSCSELIVTQKNHSAHVDGEPFDSGNEVRVSIVPKSLNVIIPEA